MTPILAIDPGSERSAWVVIDPDDDRVIAFGLDPNQSVLDMLRGGPPSLPGQMPTVVIEWTAPRGMPASAQLFETMWWAGRFTEACHPLEVQRLPRLRVKLHLCGKANAKDSNVHAELVDRYGGTGGKAAAVGLKRSPGPLYGITRDVWQALAVAVSWADGAR